MRTEKEVLKDFKKLNFTLLTIIEGKLVLAHFKRNEFYSDKFYSIYKKDKNYKAWTSDSAYFTMQEHQLLHELFTIWGWL